MRADDAEAEQWRLTGESATRADEIADLTRRMADAERDFRTQLTATNARANNAENENQRLTQQLRDTEAENQRLDQQHQQLTRQMDDRDTELAQARVQLAAMGH